MHRILILLLITTSFTAWSNSLLAQGSGAGYCEGRVIDDESKIGLPTISIVNLNKRIATLSNADGTFKIASNYGDRLRISHISYEGKTVDADLVNKMEVKLDRLTVQLGGVTVKSRYKQYQEDSARRASVYQRPLAREKTSSMMSPVSLVAEAFNKRSKQLQQFKKDFIRWEDQRFVDVRYNTEMVSNLTLLQGDSLAAFMNAYPMTYDYARIAGELEMKMWVRTNYKEWMKQPYVPTATMPVDTLQSELIKVANE